MSFAQSMFSPYRGNIKKEVIEILSEDFDYVWESFKIKDLFFLIALLSVMGLSVLKALNHAIESMQKPKATYKHLSLSRNLQADSMEGRLAVRESIDEISNHDTYSNDKSKDEKANYINTLRNQLYLDNLTLHAKTLETINYSCSKEEMYEMFRLGKITKTLSTSKITFGNDLNKLIKKVLDTEIDLKIGENSHTYFEISNNDCTFIEKALSNIYNEKVIVQFDEDNID